MSAAMMASMDGSIRTSRFRRALCAALVAGAWWIAPAPTLADETRLIAESRSLGPASPRPQTAAARPKPGAPGSGVSRTVMALGGVVGLIFILGLGVRKLARRQGGLMHALGAGGRAPSGVIEVLARYPLGGGLTLVLLRLDRRVLLLSQSAGRALRGGASMQTLCELNQPEDVASILMRVRDQQGESLAAKFHSILRREESTFDGDAPLSPARPTIQHKEQASVARGGAGARLAPPQRRLVQPPPAAAVASVRARLGTLRSASRPTGAAEAQAGVRVGVLA